MVSGECGSSQVCPLFESRPRDSRPYVTVEVLGRSVLGLIDTGASVSVLGKGLETIIQDFLPYRVDTDHRPRVTTADGSCQEVVGAVDLPVLFADKQRTVQFFLVPTIAHQMILGSDFCKCFGMRLDFLTQSFDLATVSKLNLDKNQEHLVDLTPSQVTQLSKVIKKFEKLASKAPGSTTLVEHYIDTGDARPIRQRQYPLSPTMQSHLNKLVDELLKDDVIEASISPWTSPVLLTSKKDGSYRLCFDGRKLNEVTVKDSYPLPRIDSILQKVGNAKYLTSLDLTSAFWNIFLEESSRPKTAFQVFGRGLFHFKRMPFGLVNAASSMQKLMDKVLGPELDPYVFCYLDDIVIMSNTFDRHLEILEEVHRRLKAAGLKLNFGKCKFCRDSLVFLGYVIDKKGLRTDPDKVDSILRTPTPRNTTEVRRLVGILQWYRRFIPDFSTISEPITTLIKGRNKRMPIVWSEKAEEAFCLLKERLASDPILKSPNFDLPFYIQSDASDVGVGAVIFQNYDGFEHPIAYASRKLTKMETKYSVTERECLAALFAVEKFRPYIEGAEFTLITDHASLLWLYKLKDPIGRLARWTCRLSAFKFKIVHRKGSLNVVADFLSRHIAAIEVDKFTPDPWYEEMMIKVNDRPDLYPNFLVKDNLLFKHLPRHQGIEANLSDWKVVVPTANRRDIMNECHDKPTAAHLGVSKTHSRILEKYYWPGMRHDINYYVKTCRVCGAHKTPCQAKAGLMGKAKVVSYPFQSISLDLMGPFPRSRRGNTQLLVVTDWFTKFILVQPLAKATSTKVIKFLEQVFLILGSLKPLVVITEFSSPLMNLGNLLGSIRSGMSGTMLATIRR